MIKNEQTWIGQFRRVKYYAYFRGQVPFARPRAEPARPRAYRRLAITPSRHPCPCLLLSPHAICTEVPVINLKTLPTGRLDTHRSRRPRTHLTTAVRASWRVRVGQRKSPSSRREDSSSTRPPSRPRPTRRGWYVEDWKVHPVDTRTRNSIWYAFHLSCGSRG